MKKDGRIKPIRRTLQNSVVDCEQDARELRAGAFPLKKRSAQESTFQQDHRVLNGADSYVSPG